MTVKPEILEIVDAILPALRKLVKSPELLTTEIVCEGEAHTLRVTVAKEDLGKLIGAQGRTARSLRILLVSMSGGPANRLNLDLLGKP